MLTIVGRRAAFTVTELLVTVSLLGVLAALLAPAVSSSREATRAAVCRQRLGQLGLALQGFLADHRTFPTGARGGAYGTQGVSWLVKTLPYLGEQGVYDRYDTAAPHSGSLLVHARNREVVDGLVIGVLRCPSSSLSERMPVGSTGASVMMPSYVGIAGASGDDGFLEPRVTPCCVPRVDGLLSGGGTLLTNKAVGPHRITDGMSKTIVAGESSSALRSRKGVDYRCDGAFPAGWTAGASAAGVPPSYAVPNPVWNITSIRHPLNERRFPLPGVYPAGAPNNPLLSDHPGSVAVAFCDGSSRSLGDTIALDLLKTLATRDDGGYSRGGPVQE